MKTYKYQILLILTLILASCQDDEDLNTMEDNQPEAVTQKTVQNERFVFSSKKPLSNSFSKTTSAGNQEVIANPLPTNEININDDILKKILEEVKNLPPYKPKSPTYRDNKR
jgi:hypothetical protein